MRYKIVQPNNRKSRRHRSKKVVGGGGLLLKLRQACGVICLVAFVCAVIVFVLPALPQKPAAKAKIDGYAGVLELWNVESFEGGCGSRQAWLTGRAAKFENKNKGLYVHVTTLSPSQAKDKL